MNGLVRGRLLVAGLGLKVSVELKLMYQTAYLRTAIYSNVFCFVLGINLHLLAV